MLLNNRLLQKFHFIRHLHISQIFYRLWYSVKRNTLIRIAILFPAMNDYKEMLSHDIHPQSLPLQYFTCSDPCVTVDNDMFHFSFLNQQRSFHFPFDWHLPELNSGTRLWKLNLHYMEFTKKLTDNDFIRVVTDWIKTNRPFRRDYWKDSWNSYALSIRCITLMQEYLLRQEKLPTDFKYLLKNSLYEQLEFLYSNPELDIEGNHLIKNMTALLTGSKFFSTLSAASRWEQYAITLLKKHLPEQILNDGMHYERSPAYHCLIFTDLLQMYTLLENNPIQATLLVELKKMAQVIADMTHADGKISLLNDGGLNMTYAPSDCLAAFKKITGIDIQPKKFIAFPSAGYYGLRQHDFYILIDCGKVAPDHLVAHGHGDIFSFELTIGTQRIIVDPGVYEYNPGFWREYSRSTKNHNTVTLDNHDQCYFFGAFRMGHRAEVKNVQYFQHPDGFTLTGQHDGYRHLAHAPIHQRTFQKKNNRITIQDKIIGGQNQKAIARFLLHPDCVVKQEDAKLNITCHDAQLQLIAPYPMHITKKWWLPDFGTKIEAPLIEVEYGLTPCTGNIELVLLS